MLVYPDLSRDQVVPRSLRLQSQEVAGLSGERHLAYVVETIVIAADGAAASVRFGCYFDLMIQNTAHHLRPPVAARGPLNGVAFGGGWPEIDFCHHLGVSLRILCAEEAVFANDLIRGL